MVGRFPPALDDFQLPFAGLRLGVHDTPKHLARLGEAIATLREHRLHPEVRRLGDAILAGAERLPPAAHARPDVPRGSQVQQHPVRRHQRTRRRAAGLPHRPRHGGAAGPGLRAGGCLAVLVQSQRREQPGGGAGPRHLPGLAGRLPRRAGAALTKRSAWRCCWAWTGSAWSCPPASPPTPCSRATSAGTAEQFTGRGEHNLVRAQGQWSLHQALLASRAERAALLELPAI